MAQLAAGAVGLVPGRLFLLGDSVPLDGRVSWVPADVRGWQPVNTYLLKEGDAHLVIDPGVYAHRAAVGSQLEELVTPGATVSIFLTRAEPDATGNIGEVASRFAVHRLYAGGGPNPFDAFEAASLMDPASRGERVQMERMPPGYHVPVGGERDVEVMRPAIRLLATWWGYDRLTRTLFSSDSFGHTVQAGRGDPRVLKSGDDDPQDDVGTIKKHLLAKFGWLASARTNAIVENLREVFIGREIERIAPGHGLVIEGRDIGRAHQAALETALEELAA